MAADVKGGALKGFHFAEVINEWKDFRNLCKDLKFLIYAFYVSKLRLIIYRFQIDLLLLVCIYILDSLMFEELFYLA